MSYTLPVLRTRGDTGLSATKREAMVSIEERSDHFAIVDFQDNEVHTVKYTPGNIMSHLQAHHRAVGFQTGWNEAVKAHDFKTGRPKAVDGR